MIIAPFPNQYKLQASGRFDHAEPGVEAQGPNWLSVRRPPAPTLAPAPPALTGLRVAGTHFGCGAASNYAFSGLLAAGPIPTCCRRRRGHTVFEVVRGGRQC